MRIKVLLAALIFSVEAGSLAASDCSQAMALYDKGDFAGTEKAVSAIPGVLDLPCLKLLAESQLAQGRLKEASVSFAQVAELSHQDKDSLRKLARLYSWTNRLNEAVAAYDAVIALDPADFSAVVEKARVLGWDRRYAEASLAYKAAFEASKQAWIDEERQGKESMWDRRPAAGLVHLKKAAELNDGDTEALLDLAQFYSDAGEYELAQPYYDRLLKAAPYNTAAIRSSRKNTVYRDSFRLSAGVDLLDARSPERATGVRYLNYSAAVSKRLDRNFTLAGSGSAGRYSFKGTPSLDERGAGVSLAYGAGFEGGASASYTRKAYVQNIGARENYAISGWKKVLETFSVSASAVKENLINNYANVRDSRDVLYGKTRADWDASGAVRGGADWRAGKVNDGNKFEIYGADARLAYDEAPAAFYSVLRYEHQRYNRHSAQYFAPKAYNTYSFTQVLKKNIGKEGLYYGADDLYYEIKCSVVYDESAHLSLQPAAAVYMDFSSRLNLKAGWSVTASHYYRDNYYFVNAAWIF